MIKQRSNKQIFDIIIRLNQISKMKKIDNEKIRICFNNIQDEFYGGTLYELLTSKVPKRSKKVLSSKR